MAGVETDRTGRVRTLAFSPTVPADVRVQRPEVRGKFLYVGDEKLWVRGVTYGAFRPNKDDGEYHNLDVIERDFAQMAASGLNTVRVPHTMPPHALLDAAQRHGLRVMVGLSAGQYVGFLIDKKGAPDIEALVRAKVRACSGHPALLCYALGNEIPAPMGRWLGRRRVERYLEKLYWAVKAEDPDGLVTYVNYPTTEYLQLPCLDLLCFNVYLESQERFAAYLARLQNIAGDRPLLMSEIGLDSLRNDEDTQAHVLDWQIRTTFAAGCAGAFVFAWTDEWYRAGAAVDDWAFGLTRRDRQPKPALQAVRQAFAEVPFRPDVHWPRVSVVVCSFNGANTIRDTLEGLHRLDYPNYEVIVVNDGSTDATAEITSRYDVRLIQTENRGLSNARNTGWQEATGEIIAYIDDDAYPDPHWLHYLAMTFATTTHVGVGGPNLPPPGDGDIAECVVNAPGGPVHVLLSDTEAEHIPGCNMAFRKGALAAIEGFDPQFRAAGDDVDVCWRLQQRGWSLGFSPAAVVWHHRRNSVRAYWKQQVGYGKAEALLERKHPAKYNAFGHLSWHGRVYGAGLACSLPFRRARISHGMWGSAPFQSLYEPTPGTLLSLPLMPEWYLLLLVLLGLVALDVFWEASLFALPLLVLVGGVSVLQAAISAARAVFLRAHWSELTKAKLYALTTFLHLLQPLARLLGRLRYGLAPWRRRGAAFLAWPWPRSYKLWSEVWQAPEEQLKALEATMRAQGAVVVRGGEWDCWDLGVRGGLCGSVRLCMSIEDYAQGAQLIRIRSWPQLPSWSYVVTLLLAALSGLAAMDRAWLVAVLLASVSVLLIAQTYTDCARAAGTLLVSLPEYQDGFAVQHVQSHAVSYVEGINSGIDG